MKLAVQFVVGVIGFVSAVLGILEYRDTGNVANVFSTAKTFLLNNIPLFMGLVSLLSFWVALVLVRYAPISFKEWLLGIPVGAVVLFPNRDISRYTALFHRLLATAKRIDIVGIANSQFTEKDWPEELKNAVRGGAAVRFLFLDPEGKHIGMREEEEQLTSGMLVSQVKAFVGSLKKRIEDLSSEVGRDITTVQHRFYDATPSHNVIVLDGKHVFYQPYFFSMRGRECSVYYLGAQNQSEVARITAEFERLWKASRKDTSSP